MATCKDTWSHWNSAWWDRTGTLGGLVAGVTFISFEVLVAIITPSAIDSFRALRIRGAILFGPDFIAPTAPAGAPIITGLLIHLALAAIFGLFFGIIMARWGNLARSLYSLVPVAIGYGLGLWLLNIYVLAPIYGWTWLPDETDPIVQALGHSLFFGVPLALVLHRMLASRRALGLI